jgi:hypothetical protein
MDSNRTSALLFGVLIVGVASWLLLTDARPGRGSPGAQQGSAATPAVKAARAATKGVARGYGRRGPCRDGSIGLFDAQGFLRAGRTLCAEGTDASFVTQVFVAAATGGLTNVTMDTGRCQGGTKAGQSCTSFIDCPSGSCLDPSVSGCGGDEKGRAVFFIYSGNPLGGNNDLGDELFSFDLKKHKLTQETTQAGWCSDDVTKDCTTSSDCGAMASCNTASMGDLQVSPDGKLVAFESDGNPNGAGNTSHGRALFSDIRKGKGKGFHLVGSAGPFCATNTANRGKACVKDTDCGAVCGDGKVEAPEQCDGGGYGAVGCTPPQYCGRPGAANQCTCVTPVCGNGIVEPGEECDTDSRTCGTGSTCNAQCMCVPSG